MKITKEEQENLLKYKKIVDRISDELTDYTLVDLLIKKRFDEIKYLNERVEDDLFYIKQKSNKYRYEKESAIARQPMYRREIKQNNDVLKKLLLIKEMIEKL